MNENNGYNNGENNNPNRNQNGWNPRNRQTLAVLLIATIFTILGMSLMSKYVAKSATREISYSEFMGMISSNQVEEVKITEDQIEIYPKAEAKEGTVMVYYTGIVDDPDLAKKLSESGVRYSHTIPDRSGAFMSAILNFGLPLLLVWGFLYFIMRRMGGKGGIMGVGRSNAKVYVQK